MKEIIRRKATVFPYQGKWRVQYLDTFGRQRTQTAETRKDAYLQPAEIEGQVRKGFLNLTPDEIPSLGQYLDYWLQKREPELNPTTHWCYQSHVANNLKPLMRNLRLDTVTARQIQDLYSYLAEERSFIDEASTDLPEFASLTAWARNWLPSGMGVSGLNLNLVFYAQALRTEIYFGSADPEVNQARFDAVLANKDAIEAFTGGALEWNALDGKKACRISYYGPDGGIEQTQDWAAYRKWFLDSFALMKKVVKNEVLPRVKG